MTVDFGHAYLTSRYFGDDFLGNIEAAKPYLRHIHIHDNLGIFDTARLKWQQKSLKQRLPFGKGDLHLPIGWGEIPFKDVFKILGDDYSGIYMLENSIGTNERFVPDIVGTLLDFI
jgi:sugar phosphate isomerase/epimerase